MPSNSLTEADVFSSSGSDSSRESCSTCASAESSSQSQQKSLDNVDGTVSDDMKRFETVNDTNLLDPTDSNERVSFEVSDVCNQTDESKLVEESDRYVLATNYDKVVNQMNNVSDDVSSRLENIENDNIRQDTKPDDSDNSVESAKMKTNLNSGVYLPVPHSTPSTCSSRSSLSVDTDKNGHLILDKPQVQEIYREEIHGTWLSVHLKIQQSQSGAISDEVDGHINPQR